MIQRVYVDVTQDRPARAIACARSADGEGLGVWIGGHDTEARDDPAVMIAAAVCAVTTRSRICVALRDLRHPLRLAEAVAHLDILSGGRIEMYLEREANAVPLDGDRWLDAATQLLDPARDTFLDDGRALPVTPLTVQPTIPFLVSHGSRVPRAPGWTGTVAASHGASNETSVRTDTAARVAYDAAFHQTASEPRPLRGRIVMPLGCPAVAAESAAFLHSPSPASLLALRAVLEETGVTDVVVDLPPDTDIGGRISLLSRTLLPGLRCAKHEAASLVVDLFRHAP